MCLSSVYKEIALGETELDPVYLNAWIAVFQFLFSIPLAIPAGYASSPQVSVTELPDNLWDGLQCWVGTNSVTCSNDDDTCVADDCFPWSPVRTYLPLPRDKSGLMLDVKHVWCRST